MASSASFAIRVLGPSDVALMEALNDVFGEAFESVSTYRDSRPSRAYLEDLLGSDYFIAVVAVRDDEVVGGLAGYELKKFEQERSEVYIYDLAVAEPHRRLGIATALLAEVKRIAAARGAWVAFVQADLDDEPAIALYSKLGKREDVVQFDMETDA